LEKYALSNAILNDRSSAYGSDEGSSEENDYM
jgi:hypothetical protein